MDLKRRFSPWTLLILSINGMVGSAWLFAPLYAAKIAGAGALIAWLLGGGATALIALTFAELSTLVPVAGGTVEIPQISHGTLTSFILSWIAWLSALTMAPIEILAVLQYASTYPLFSSLTTLQNHVPVLTPVGLGCAAVLMFFLCFMNSASFKGLVRFNFLFFLFKVFVILCVVFSLPYARFHSQHFLELAQQTSALHWKHILAAVASGGIAFAFTGFKHGVELAGEAKDSSIAIPLATVGSVLCCLLLYLGLQVAFIGAIDPSMISKGWSNLNFTGDIGPFAGLATVLGLAWLVKWLYVDAIISPLGAGFIYVTSTARIFYAMSQRGLFPLLFTRLNQENLPVAAIFLNFVLGMFLFLPFPSWQSMVSFLTSGMVLSYAMGPIALLCLRKELPDIDRKFRLPCAPILCWMAFYFCNLLSYWTGWETLWKLGISLLTGFVFFAAALRRGHLKSEILGLTSAYWLIPYLGGLILISYLGADTFGGKNMIPFGWDFLVIAIFNTIILYLAVKNRTHTLKNQYHQMKAS